MENPNFQAFLTCCGSSRFAEEMVKASPFLTLSEAIQASREIWWHKVDIPSWLEAFAAHPRIGDLEALKRKAPDTEWCKGEQSVAMNGASDTILQEIADWNQRYESKFGFSFIISATGKSSSEILVTLKERYGGRHIDEIQLAAAEQQKITEIRLGKLFKEHGHFEINLSSGNQVVEHRLSQIGGHFKDDIKDAHATISSSPSSSQSIGRPPITTHVLDVSIGKPGASIDVVLDVWNEHSVGENSGEWINVGSSITNSDGRSGPLMAPSSTVSAGKYRLTFNTGAYFQKLAVVSFYPFVSVVFEIKPNQISEHFHVPVLLSPFSYTTYRGS